MFFVKGNLEMLLLFAIYFISDVNFVQAVLALFAATGLQRVDLIIVSFQRMNPPLLHCQIITARRR